MSERNADDPAVSASASPGAVVAGSPDRAATAFPPRLRELEATLVARRRIGAGSEVGADAPAVALALSGGGVRSATFSLGVLQALAAVKALQRIDYLSTVSGGGYIGGFLSMLFRRRGMTMALVEDFLTAPTAVAATAPPAAVAASTAGGDARPLPATASPPAASASVPTPTPPPVPTPAGPATRPGIAGPRVFRWLRENGRYLAPQGTGDLLIGGAVLLRNWTSVLMVLSLFALTLLLVPQLARYYVRMACVADLAAVAWLPTWLVGAFSEACAQPAAGSRFIWWSPYWPLLPGALLLVTLPSAWAYWLVASVEPRRHTRWLRARRRLQVWSAWLVVVGVASAVFVVAREPDAGIAYASPFAVVIGGVGLLSALVFFVSWWRSGLLPHETSGVVERAQVMRRRLTALLAGSLAAAATIAVFVGIDSLAQTIYVLAHQSDGSALAAWSSSVFATLAAMAAMARRVAVVVGRPDGAAKAPSVPAGLVAGVAAACIYSVALVAVDVVAIGIVWQLQMPDAPPPELLGGLVPAVTERGLLVPVVAFVATALVCVLIGHTWTFLNDSTLQPLYGSRLARAYLGASNPHRNPADGRMIRAVEPVAGDDAGIDTVWWRHAVFATRSLELRPLAAAWAGMPQWLQPLAMPLWKSLATPLQRLMTVVGYGSVRDGSELQNGFEAGAPLHLINVTVNETLDGTTGVQNQDRKGIGLAVGPFGMSAGVRHHIFRDGFRLRARPDDGFSMFRDGAGMGESLSLGQWMGISASDSAILWIRVPGAAFSTGLGMRTSLAFSLLAGFFNVRLGYWWDSGVGGHQHKVGRGVRNPLRTLFPVQMHLADEFAARFLGPARRHWYLTDGGHFENMGGYELIRRRVPVIVIVDAEEDADYRFEGLANLVRKARLDFSAEIRFLDAHDLCVAAQQSAWPELTSLFGSLDMLRRGTWEREERPAPDAADVRLQGPDRSALSARCAALATVTYDGATKPTSLLVYLKPALTGAEPADLAHYHHQHPDFPHEPTADQFFGEDQWESYRKLGECIGNRVLGCGFERFIALRDRLCA